MEAADGGCRWRLQMAADGSEHLRTLFPSLFPFRLNNVATPAAWLALSPGDRAKALSEMKNHRARKERVSQKDRDTLQAAT